MCRKGVLMIRPCTHLQTSWNSVCSWKQTVEQNFATLLPSLPSSLPPSPMSRQLYVWGCVGCVWWGRGGQELSLSLLLSVNCSRILQHSCSSAHPYSTWRECVLSYMFPGPWDSTPLGTFQLSISIVSVVLLVSLW